MTIATVNMTALPANDFLHPLPFVSISTFCIVQPYHINLNAKQLFVQNAEQKLYQHLQRFDRKFFSRQK